jgi:hypothetical protein
MIYHMGCKNHCGQILTTEEADPEKNPGQRCKWCKDRNLKSPEEVVQYAQVVSPE